MARTTSPLRLLGIALAAIAGLVSAGEARACGATPAAPGARSCCAGRPAPGACGCCTPARTPPAARVVAVPTVTRPAVGCVCRPAAPVDPATPPGPSVGPTRADGGGAVGAAVAFGPRPRIAQPPVIRVDPPPAGPARLRTVRLRT